MQSVITVAGNLRDTIEFDRKKFKLCIVNSQLVEAFPKSCLPAIVKSTETLHSRNNLFTKHGLLSKRSFTVPFIFFFFSFHRKYGYLF